MPTASAPVPTLAPPTQGVLSGVRGWAVRVVVELPEPLLDPLLELPELLPAELDDDPADEEEPLDDAELRGAPLPEVRDP
jgi:hypothetical protein